MNTENRKPYQLVVVDDNPDPALMIKSALERAGVPIECLYFDRPTDAISFLQTNDCDILFTDVDMPQMSGYDMLELIENPPYVVIMTDFPEKFAPKAFDFYEKNLLDFMPKSSMENHLLPIIERFDNRQDRECILVINSDDKSKNTKIAIDNIAYFQRDNQLTFVNEVGSTTNKYFVRKNFEELAEILPKNSWFQIRQATIVMLRHITSVSLTTVSLGTDEFGNEISFEIPLRKRKALHDLLNDDYFFGLFRKSKRKESLQNLKH